jgi:hypothetical protein
MISEKPKADKPVRRKLKSPNNRLRSPKKRSHKAKGKGRERVSIGFATIHKSDNADEFR